MYQVTMPKLSDSMEDGKIIEWKVKPGDRVKEGDVLAEIESDKAVMELECFSAGVVEQILHKEGDEVAVGEVIATIAPAAQPSEAKKLAQEPPVQKMAPKAKPQPAKAIKSKPAERVEPVRHEREQPKISPYAKKLAEERGVDWTKLSGSGPGGRIVAADIEKQAASPTPRIKPSADEELPPLDASPEDADVEDADYRLRTQARRVTSVKHLIPHFYLTRPVDVTRLFELKDRLKSEHKATITHVVMFACLRAIEQMPEINRSYDHGKIFKWKGVNLGLAVDTPQGLTVAVLRGADRLSFRELVTLSNDLIERARAGKLTGDERKHASFTISNLGMFGIEHFEPIINPPSAITLGVASAREETIVRDGAIHIARIMRLTASCDHRILDGVTGAKFLAELASLLEKADVLVK